MTAPNFRHARSSRPHPRETVNGDAHWISPVADGLLVLVTDGLGHGAGAHEASRVAVEHLAAHVDPDAPAPSLDALLRSTHEALRGTRGVAAGLLWAGASEGAFCGVGNVEVRAWGGVSLGAISMAGVLGGRFKRTQTFRFPWPGRTPVVVFTDGIERTLDLSGHPPRDLQAAADGLLRAYGRPNDDATAVVIARDD